MLRLLNSDKPALLFVVPLVIIACWAKSFFPSESVVFSFDSNPMPLYAFFAKYFGSNKALSVITSLFLVFIQVIILIRINVRHRLIEQNTYFPAIIYGVLTASFPGMMRLNPLLFSNLLLLICIYVYFGFIKERHNLNPFYESGLLLGLASLFYFNTVFLFPLLLMSLSGFRTFYWREWMMVLLGFLSIVFLTFTYYFFFDKLPELSALIKNNAFVKNKYPGIALFNLVFWGFNVILLILAILVVFSGVAKKISTRKFYSNFIALIFLVTLFFLVVPGIGAEMFFFAIIPFSYYLSNYLINMKSSSLSEGVFMVFIILFILAQIVAV